MNLSEESKGEIVWWLENIERVNGKPIRHEEKMFSLQTDSSSVGWGAVLTDNSTRTQGRWSSEESLLHINILELKAIYFALKSLCRDLHDIQILVKTDTATAVSYINNMGGSVKTLFK